MANFSGSIPTGVYDPEYYVTATATFNYAATFAGGGGGFGGFSVPGSGQVNVVPYAPYTYTNMVGPGYYFTSQGVSFKLEKCYTIPPLTVHHEVAEVSPDVGGGGIVFDPIEGLDAIKRHWRQPVNEPIDEAAPPRTEERK